MICVVASMCVLAGAGALPISTAAASPSTQVVSAKMPAKEKVTRKVTKKKVTKKATKTAPKKATSKKTAPKVTPKAAKKVAPTKVSAPAANPASKPTAKAAPIKTYVVKAKSAPAPLPAQLRTTPKATGKSWKVVARKNITTQAQVDRCANTPATWHGYWHVVAHNYCNGWAADAWHGMRRGDRVTLTLPSGQVVTGLVAYDLTIRYGGRWDDMPPAGAGYFSLQTSWRDSIHRDSSHIIVVKRA